MNYPHGFSVRGVRLFLALALFVLTTLAAGAPLSASRTHRPYRFELAACDGKAQGATCGYTDRTGANVVGHCVLVPDRVPSDPRATVVQPPPLLMCRKAP